MGQENNRKSIETKMIYVDSVVTKTWEDVIFNKTLIWTRWD